MRKSAGDRLDEGRQNLVLVLTPGRRLVEGQREDADLFLAREQGGAGLPDPVRQPPAAPGRSWLASRSRKGPFFSPADTFFQKFFRKFFRKRIFFLECAFWKRVLRRHTVGRMLFDRCRRTVGGCHGPDGQRRAVRAEQGLGSAFCNHDDGRLVGVGKFPGRSVDLVPVAAFLQGAESAVVADARAGRGERKRERSDRAPARDREHQQAQRGVCDDRLQPQDCEAVVRQAPGGCPRPPEGRP